MTIGFRKASRLSKASSPCGFFRFTWCIVLLGTGLFSPTALQATPPESPLIHKRAPAFVRSDLNGARVNLRAYRGKVVLLNFWATWCGPCLEELPRFGDWQKQYGTDGLQVIAVSMDDDAAPVRMLVRKLKLDFPVVMGDARLGRRYGGVLGLPITFLIGRDGKVKARIDGASDLHAMENTITALLRKREP